MTDNKNDESDEVQVTEEQPTKTELTAEDWKNKGNDFYKNKSYREAVAAYTKAIELEPTNGSYFTNRAAASLMLLQYKETVQDCDAAIALDNSNSKAYFRKVTALKGLGRLQDAITALNAGLIHDPKSVTAIKDLEALNSAKTELAEIAELIREKKFRVALPKIDKLISSLGSNFRDLNIMRVECLLELKRPEDAYNLTNSMMRTAMNGDVDLLRLRAQCFYVMGDIENSLKHLQQAVRSDPDNTTVRTFYRKIKEIDDKKAAGDEQFKKGNWQGAIDLWSECIELTRDNRPYACKLYLNRATALAKLKEHKNALKDCNIAIGFNTNYVKAYLKRIDCLMAIGGPENIESAISDYEKLIEIEQDEDKTRDYQQKIKKAKVALKRSKRKDLYAILGVEQTATEAEIKSAYRKSALKYHPDKQQNKSDSEKAEAEAMFKSIGEAYEILSNPETKQKYDDGVEVEDMDNPHAGHGHGHGHHGMDPNMMFQMFMQQQQAQGGGRSGRGGGFSFGGF